MRKQTQKTPSGKKLDRKAILSLKSKLVKALDSARTEEDIETLKNTLIVAQETVSDGLLWKYDKKQVNQMVGKWYRSKTVTGRYFYVTSVLGIDDGGWRLCTDSISVRLADFQPDVTFRRGEVINTRYWNDDLEEIDASKASAEVQRAISFVHEFTLSINTGGR